MSEVTKKTDATVPKSLYEQIVDVLISELELKEEFKGFVPEIDAWMSSEEKDAEELAKTLTKQKSHEDH